MKLLTTALWRWLGLVVLAAVALQLFFVLRIALAVWWDPASTTFQRSEMWRIWHQSAQQRSWQQQWVGYDDIAPALKQAVLTSEDDLFTDHGGVQWNALQRAWERNQKAQARAAAQAGDDGATPRRVALHGGSTITQQLAKNLLLSGERSFLRKGQELVLTQLLELMLSKRRILEIYLNHVEWGQGIFGAEAAARHYFGKPARRLTPSEAAKLAVMLPNPRYYERNWNSGYLQQRSRAILRRMAATPVP